MTMEIITLIENDSCDVRLTEEFGLSLLVRCPAGNLLFDMGKSAQFSHNAEILEENLTEVDCAVISHAHYDHGGGLAAFAQNNISAPIYIGREADGEYLADKRAKIHTALHPLIPPVLKSSPFFFRYVGLDDAVLKQYAERIVVVENTIEILKDVYLLPSVEQGIPLALGNKFLWKKKDNTLLQDSFDHELIMVIRESGGLIVFTGCGHRGILNMLSTVNRLFPGEKIKAVIGGFHLALQPGKPQIAGSEEDIIAIAQKFDQLGVEKVISGHCTGEDACTILQDQLGDRFDRFSTGSRHVI